MWYVLHLFVDLDKFLLRYSALATSTLAMVENLVSFRRPDKAMYQRDLGLFIGYVFVQVSPTRIHALQEALKTAGLAEVLPAAGTNRLMPLSKDEVSWVYDLLRSSASAGVIRGTSVRITEGPFEGMEGTVEAIAGQTVSVRVPLRRSVATAQCALDTVEAV
jgi:transcription antitermination factor NusG